MDRPEEQHLMAPSRDCWRMRLTPHGPLFQRPHTTPANPCHGCPMRYITHPIKSHRLPHVMDERERKEANVSLIRKEFQRKWIPQWLIWSASILKHPNGFYDIMRFHDSIEAAMLLFPGAGCQRTDALLLPWRCTVARFSSTLKTRRIRRLHDLRLTRNPLFFF